MLEILLLVGLIAGGAAGMSGGEPAAPDSTTATIAQPPASSTATTVIAPTPAPAPAAPTTEVAMGKFTTAGEVRPILNATKNNWIAVREWDGRDLVYFTQLESWRCGLSMIYYGVNGAPAATPYPAAPCNPDSPAPNALPSDGHLTFVKFPLQSVQQVDVRIVYDDGTEDSASYLRKNVLMP